MKRNGMRRVEEIGKGKGRGEDMDGREWEKREKEGK